MARIVEDGLLPDGFDGPLREELENGRRYGDRTFTLVLGGVPLAVASAHFHQERKNAWTPYVNWVVAWTRPDVRRRGYGRALSDFLRAEARARGCVRLRSVAASLEGVAFHVALGDALWARSSAGTILVDSPLDGRPFPRATPASVRAVTSRLEPLSPAELAPLLREPLLYREVS